MACASHVGLGGWDALGGPQVEQRLSVQNMPREGSGEMGQGTMRTGLWEAWLCPVQTRAGQNEWFDAMRKVGRRGGARSWGSREKMMGLWSRAGPGTESRTKLVRGLDGSDLVPEKKLWGLQDGDAVVSGLGPWVDSEALHQDGSPGEEQVWEQEKEFNFAYKVGPEKYTLEGAIRLVELFESPIQGRAELGVRVRSRYAQIRPALKSWLLHFQEFCETVVKPSYYEKVILNCN